MPPRNFLCDLQASAFLPARPGTPPLLPRANRAVAGGNPQRVQRRGPALAAHALLLAAALVLAVAPHGAQGAGLGRLSVHSALGQPLDAEVEVPAVGRDEAPSLQVRLASQAAFKQANLEFNPALTQLRVDLQTRPDGT